MKITECSAKEMGEILGYSPQKISALIQQGAPASKGGGRGVAINSAEFIAWLLRHEKGKLVGMAPEVGDLGMEKARQAKETADNLALKNAQLRKELVSAAEVEQLYTAMVTTFKDRLRSLGSKLAPIIPIKKSVAERKAFIDDYVDEVLRELAK